MTVNEIGRHAAADLLVQLPMEGHKLPKFLIKANYTAEGMKGLHKEKASGREKAIATACAALGGKLDAVYFALGDDDVFAIVDLPSHLHVASLSVAAGASGMVSTHTVPLLTVADGQSTWRGRELPAAWRLATAPASPAARTAGEPRVHLDLTSLDPVAPQTVRVARAGMTKEGCACWRGRATLRDSPASLHEF